MFRHEELSNLIDMAGVRRMENGWQVVIRADWADVTEQQPHGLSYALILQNECGERILGFDNSHGFDGADEQDPWDHEHRVDHMGQRFRYDFVSASRLISDFFDKVEHYCADQNVSSAFIVEDDHE
ncbi:toxin-antitoxin system TumE family protein [Oleispirillum naphthae]|uniref:toxin-antitoxin system TumE family protein n=1 Tax=Oleispirillum naphthae TaxID=2838853 RepID=UPI0030825D04